MQNLVPTLTAQQSPLVQSLLQHKKPLLQAIQMLPEGHVHIVLPQQMKQNIARIRTSFEQYAIEPRLFISHKPSKSNALIKQARAEGAGLDVSSKNELISAFKNGFSGENICCTGSKNDDYITLSIQHGCLHSADSIEELKRYVELTKIINPKGNNRILLRINSVDAPSNGKISRFGMHLHHLNDAFELLKQQPQIHLQGFHMHSGENGADLRAQELAFLVELIQQSYKLGFKPTLIDIGGALPQKFYENPEECDAFVQEIIAQLMQQRPPFTWRNYCYGVEIAPNGSALGQENLKSKFRSEGLEDFLKRLLCSEPIQGREAYKVITECGFNLAIEPGSAAYNQCGLILFKVVETRTNAKGEHITVLDGNVFNLSFNIMEYMADPILLSHQENTNNEVFSTYLVGNLCADFDVMIKRQVVLKGQPKAGDYLCFINTAAYTADFHDAPVHQHPMGQKMVALKHGSDWHFTSEDRFNPYLCEKE